MLNVTLDTEVGLANDLNATTGDFPIAGLAVTTGGAGGDTGTLRLNFKTSSTLTSDFVSVVLPAGG